METLDGTSWDAVIAGTGLQPAFLALALSRSGKKVLHLDRDDYYGGSVAALSTAEAEIWAAKINESSSGSTAFRHATASAAPPSKTDRGPKLAAPRSYNLSLAPQLIYTRSALLAALVSSKSHEQLEFLAVGNWFVWRPITSADGGESDGSLIRVPNSREDIFSDAALSLRAKSALVKFLRFVAVYEDEDKRIIWEQYKGKPFSILLSNAFKILPEFHGPLLALTMSTSAEAETEDSLKAIHRHLTSMGVFGAGFSAVLPKYGGLSEVVQVACRAAAVGGAVYVLNKAIEAVDRGANEADQTVHLSLQDGDKVSAPLVFSTNDQLPHISPGGVSATISVCSRLIAVVGSRLQSLFPPPAEGSPPPSAAVVVFPPSTITDLNGQSNSSAVHIFVHSSDTGECPAGQCVVYASTMHPLDQARSILEHAVDRVVTACDSMASVLWRLSFEIHSSGSATGLVRDEQCEGLYRFVEPAAVPVFDDGVLDGVREAWSLVTGGVEGNFLKFGERTVDAELEDGDDE